MAGRTIIAENVFRGATWRVVRSRRADGSVTLVLAGEHPNGHPFMTLTLVDASHTEVVFDDSAPCVHPKCPGVECLEAI